METFSKSPKPTAKLTRKSWMVSPLQDEALKKESGRTGYSESEIVRRALDGYLFGGLGKKPKK